MADSFMCEIRIFPYNFAPRGWALCNGQLMSISQNTALFSLMGTTYGGDGRTTFALPNLQGAVPVGKGQGRGLSPYDLGETLGVDYVTLLMSEMPAHNHQVTAQTIDQGDNRIPSPTLNLGNTQIYQNASSSNATLNPIAITPTGNNEPHDNLMPYVTFNYCISLQGTYPKRP